MIKIVSYIAIFALTSLMATTLSASSIVTLQDVAYGEHERQRFDVYFTEGRQNQPVIFMVHGGGWKIGDKSNASVVKNKVKHWVPKGFVFISTNYRLVPDAHPIEQTQDIAQALAHAQQKAAEWGGDKERFILMGHSAGAHLVSLFSSQPQYALESGVTPWLATISIDSAAYDIEDVMSRGDAPRMYRQAFGKRPSYWKDASPYFQLKDKIPPFLAICSSQRKDDICEQAEKFTRKAKEFGATVKVMPYDLSHRGLNVKLGKRNQYTQDVNAFIEAVISGN